MIATCLLQRSMLFSPVWGLNAPQFSLQHRIWMNLDLFASFHLVEAAWKKKVPAALQGAAVNSQMASTLLRFYADVSKLNTGQFKLTCISLLQPASNRIGHRQLDSDCISKIPQALITVARNKQFLLQIASEENRFDFSLWKRLKHRCN